MGEGLKRVAQQCGGLVVKANGKTVKYDADGKRICTCDMRTKLVGDGCSVCNPELYKDLLKGE